VGVISNATDISPFLHLAEVDARFDSRKPIRLVDPELPQRSVRALAVLNADVWFAEPGGKLKAGARSLRVREIPFRHAR
jgi:hypothetical protein